MLTLLLTRAADRLGEDVSDTCRVLAENVGVDAQGHGGVTVAEASGDDVDRDACQQQRGRMQVSQIMQPGIGRVAWWLTCYTG